MVLSCGTASANDLTSMTQDAIQQNESVNAPTSVMSNTQVNSGVTFDSYGGGVTCSRTTVQMGATSSINAHSGYNTGTQLYVGVNIPFGNGTDCKNAAKAQLFLNKQRTLTLKELMRRDNENHKQEMKKKDLMYADLLAKVCMNFHGKVAARNDSVMAKECASYQVIDHHNAQYDTNYSRVSK